MFSEPIEFPGAVVKTVVFKKKDGVNQTRIDVQCGVTEAVARELGCRDVLYLKNGAPRQGFTGTELDTGCKSLRALFQPDKTLKQSLEINGDQAEGFYVERASSGDYRLSFQLHCSIAPLEIWNYVDRVGDAPAILKLAPLQQEIDQSKPGGDEDTAQKTVQRVLKMTGGAVN